MFNREWRTAAGAVKLFEYFNHHGVVNNIIRLDNTFPMAQIGRLKFSMGATLFILTTLFFIFLVGIDLIIAYFTDYSFSWLGLLILVPFAILFVLLQWAISPWIVKRSAGINEDTISAGQNNAFLMETVEKLCSDAGVPMPTLAIINNPEPNAFVFGRTMKSTYLAVHDSLLRTMTKEEIQSVLAHEVGHIKHKDHITMTVISAIPLITYITARIALSSIRGMRGGGKGKGQAVIIMLIVGAISYLIYLITQILVLHLSRSREYYADYYSATATRNPAGLQSALVKLMTGLSTSRDRDTPSGLRSFYAVDPVQADVDNRRYRERMSEYDLNSDGIIDEKELDIAMEKESRNPWRRANELFSTHPSIYKRVLMLRKMELDMEAQGIAAGGTVRPMTPAEKPYIAGPSLMGGGEKNADAAWKD